MMSFTRASATEEPDDSTAVTRPTCYDKNEDEIAGNYGYAQEPRQLTCAIGGCPGFSSRTPMACTAGIPPLLSRIAVAMRIASARSSVHGGSATGEASANLS